MSLRRKVLYLRNRPPTWEVHSTIPGYRYLGLGEIDGKRHYNIDGNMYPSVTTFISEHTDDSWIDDITSVIGEDKFKRLGHIASKNGTQLHDMCQEFLLGKPVQPTPNVSIQWKALYENLFKPERIGKLYLVEGVVASHKLKIAGRCDLIADLDGETHVIDFKNVQEIKSKEDILPYLIQTCLYSLLYKESYGVSVPRLAIIMTSTTGQLSIMKATFSEYQEKLKAVLNGEMI